MRGMRGNIYIYIYVCMYRYTLEEYWQIFVDDGLVPRDATDLQANAQPKAVFSYAMTVMGKICCWDNKWVVSLYVQLVCQHANFLFCQERPLRQPGVAEKGCHERLRNESLCCDLNSAAWVSSF